MENHNMVYMNKFMPKQPPEKEFGNKEYKRLFQTNRHHNSIKELIRKRTSQLLFRLIEGDGKAIYLLGIDDDGEVVGLNDYELENTLNFMKRIVKEAKGEINNIRIYKGGKGNVCSVRVILDEKILRLKQKNYLII